MSLRDLLWWLGTPGAGVLAFFLIDHWPWAKALGEEARHFLSLGLSGALALLAWGAQIAMLYKPVPTDWRAGIEEAVALIFVAFGVSQLAVKRTETIRRNRLMNRR